MQGQQWLDWCACAHQGTSYSCTAYRSSHMVCILLRVAGLLPRNTSILGHAPHSHGPAAVRHAWEMLFLYLLGLCSVMPCSMCSHRLYMHGQVQDPKMPAVLVQ
jgi:hypothetical protein